MINAHFVREFPGNVGQSFKRAELDEFLTLQGELCDQDDSNWRTIAKDSSKEARLEGSQRMARSAAELLDKIATRYMARAGRYKVGSEGSTTEGKDSEAEGGES